MPIDTPPVSLDPTDKTTSSLISELNRIIEAQSFIGLIYYENLEY